MDTSNISQKESSVPAKEVVYLAKTNNFKKKLISLAVILAIMLIAAAVAWFNGMNIANKNAKQKLAELEKTIQEQQSQIKELKESPIVVSPASPTINLELIHSEINNIGELATTEYLFTDAAKFSDSKQIKNWNIPFTEKSFILRWSGKIKAGVELSKVTIDVDAESKKIVVSVPTAKILSYSVDSDSVEVLNEKDNIFNNISVDDKVKFDAKTEEAMKNRAIENGLIEKAQKNAEDILLRLIQSDPVAHDNYTVEFVINNV